MAEGLIRARLTADGRNGDVQVRSAGTWAPTGLPPTDDAIATMAARGIDISGYRAREVDLAMVNEADLILVMTSSHLQALESEFPSARGKVRLLSSLAGGAWNIADPVGGTPEDYDVTAHELARLIEVGWPMIVAAQPRPRR